MKPRNQLTVLNRLRKLRPGSWRPTGRLFQAAGEEAANARGPIQCQCQSRYEEHTVGQQQPNEGGNTP